jgi:transcriptional regulator with XRE-family HTH domain
MVVRTFLPYSKTVKKPASKAVPLFLNTLGDHIRKKRVDNGLLQKDAAIILGVCEDSITHWENNRAQPQVQHYPAIILFLGYYPFVHEPESFAGSLRRYRYSKGYSYEAAGNEFGVNASTVRGWEQSLYVPAKRTQSIVEAHINKFFKQQYRSE